MVASVSCIYTKTHKFMHLSFWWPTFVSWHLVTSWQLWIEVNFTHGNSEEVDLIYWPHTNHIPTPLTGQIPTRSTCSLLPSGTTLHLRRVIRCFHTRRCVLFRQPEYSKHQRLCLVHHPDECYGLQDSSTHCLVTNPQHAASKELPTSFYPPPNRPPSISSGADWDRPFPSVLLLWMPRSSFGWNLHEQKRVTVSFEE